MIRHIDKEQYTVSHDSQVMVRGDGQIVSEVVSSQAEMLTQYGGVFPKMAEEGHAKAIDKVVSEAILQAGVKESSLSAIAVTIGPGLSLCLRVGVRKARSLAKLYQLPWIGVHHMEAHAMVARLMDRQLEFPFLVLLVSGGHNLLLLAQKVGDYIQLGTTLDDAIGEAYDKTARELGLDLARGGGPAVEELALEGNPKAVNFSIPMRNIRDCNFSFAGLKTQVKLAIASKAITTELVPIKDADAEDRQLRADIAASFQRVAVLHLEDRCARAIEWAQSMSPIKALVVSGGVASNKVVRQRLGELAEKHGLRLSCPPPRLCTDNGVMIAWTGVEHFKLGRSQPPPPYDEPEDVHLDLRPRWQLGEIYTEGQRHTRSSKTASVHPSLTAEMRMHSSS
ncbi:hypothetical protein GOP47_0012167 [Adiantum capillus-veneris]|uniref:Glycoprotease 1 n=1 Tax=Adiantum capillus-veneris TaxID=13818 RepID=A0A9D4UQW9_ADICA|nr:hypothetical protein GOP47_0012167 [Adiantum capillus-veneris]